MIKLSQMVSLNFVVTATVYFQLCAELALNCIAQPGEVAGDNALIQAVGRIKLTKPFVIALCARLGGQLHGHILHVGAWETSQQSIDNECHTDQNQDRQQDSFDDIFSQGNPSVFSTYWSNISSKVLICSCSLNASHISLPLRLPAERQTRIRSHRRPAPEGAGDSAFSWLL